MALRFPCEYCGKEIIVRYLKPGDKALCRNCDRYGSVPENAAPTDEVPDYHAGPHRTAGSSAHPGGTPPYTDDGRSTGGHASPGELGPRTLGDFLGETFSVYGAKFLRLMAVAAGPTIIIFALTYLPRLYMVNAMNGIRGFSFLHILALIPSSCSILS